MTRNYRFAAGDEDPFAEQFVLQLQKGGSMKSFVRRLRYFGNRDEGASAVEYALLVALIAIVISIGVFALGTNLNTLFSNTADCVAQDPPGTC